MIEEIVWKVVPNTNGRYDANSKGVIYDNKLGRRVPYSKNKRGWLRCHIWFGDKRRTIGVHRVIMMTFYGESDLTVNHIDGNKENNCLNNLEYSSVADNNRHRSTVLKKGNIRKVRCVETGKIYNSIAEAERETGCWHIGDVCKNKYGFKSTKGLTFEYVE